MEVWATASLFRGMNKLRRTMPHRVSQGWGLCLMLLELLTRLTQHLPQIMASSKLCFGQILRTFVSVFYKNKNKNTSRDFAHVACSTRQKRSREKKGTRYDGDRPSLIRVHSIRSHSQIKQRCQVVEDAGWDGGKEIHRQIPVCFVFFCRYAGGDGQHSAGYY